MSARPLAPLLLAVTLQAACDLSPAEIGGLPPLPASPAPVFQGRTFTSLDLSRDFGGRLCATTTTGEAACWRLEIHSAQPPAEVAAGAALVDISVGSRHQCALTADGAAYCWGDNTFGALGDGTRQHRDAPGLVAGGHTFTRVQAGSEGTCGVTDEGGLLCWGLVRLPPAEPDPDCPDCPRVDTVPTPVDASTPYIDVALGLDHACALTEAGEVLCWGANHAGQGGRPAPTILTEPTPIDFDGTFASIAAGPSNTCGLDGGGVAYCWGRLPASYSGPGEFGFVHHTQPVPVDTDFRFSSIYPAEAALCALDDAGRAYCWGHNQAGRLGTGDDRFRDTPAPVTGGLTFTVIAPADSYTCAVQAGTGLLYCWGEYTEP